MKPLTSRFVLLRNRRGGMVKAVQAGETGVFEPMSTDRMVALFEDEFEVLGRDSYGPGLITPTGSIDSEVICLRRRDQAAA